MTDVIKIKVGQHKVGIIGIKQVLSEMANGCGGMSDEEIQMELLNRLSKKNYISENVKNDYGLSFLREFKKFIGEPFDKNGSDLLEIKVLGQGCSRCNQLEQEIMSVVSEMNIAADIEHVTNIAEIGWYGVMGTPALVINGKVVAVGSVPARAKIKVWLKEIEGNN